MEKGWAIAKAFNGGIETWSGKGKSDVLSSVLGLDVEKLKSAIEDGQDLNQEITYKKDDVTITGTALYYLLSTNPIKPEVSEVSYDLPTKRIHDGLLHTTVKEKTSTKEDLMKAERKNLERATTIIEMAELMLNSGAKLKTSDKNFKTKIAGLEEIAERARG